MNREICIGFETVFNVDGNKLRALTPDDKGVYRRIPVALFDANSTNNTRYDSKSALNSMLDPNTTFNIKWKRGGLKGEFGHPHTRPDDIERMLYIKPEQWSHHFVDFTHEKSRDGSFIIVYADLVPDGPFADVLDRSLRSPVINTAFSLRSLFRTKAKEGAIDVREVLAMITFDFVDVGGFQQCSKIFAQPGVETLAEVHEVDLQKLMNIDAISQIFGCEHLSKQELLDKLQIDSASIGHRVIGVFDAKRNVLLDSTGAKRSVFHQCYKGF